MRNRLYPGLVLPPTYNQMEPDSINSTFDQLHVDHRPCHVFALSSNLQVIDSERETNRARIWSLEKIWEIFKMEKIVSCQNLASIQGKFYKAEKINNYCLLCTSLFKTSIEGELKRLKNQTMDDYRYLHATIGS